MQYSAEHIVSRPESRPNNINMHGWLLKHGFLCGFYHSLLKKAYQIYNCCGTFTGERRLNLLGFKSSIVCNYHHLQKWSSASILAVMAMVWRDNENYWIGEGDQRRCGGCNWSALHFVFGKCNISLHSEWINHFLTWIGGEEGMPHALV